MLLAENSSSLRPCNRYPCFLRCWSTGNPSEDSPQDWPPHQCMVCSTCTWYPSDDRICRTWVLKFEQAPPQPPLNLQTGLSLNNTISVRRTFVYHSLFLHSLSRPHLGICGPPKLEKLEKEGKWGHIRRSQKCPEDLRSLQVLSHCLWRTSGHVTACLRQPADTSTGSVRCIQPKMDQSVGLTHSHRPAPPCCLCALMNYNDSFW